LTRPDVVATIDPSEEHMSDGMGEYTDVQSVYRRLDALERFDRIFQKVDRTALPANG
jgi:hypothetical protein